MAYSEQYQTNEAYRNFLQTICSQTVEFALDGSLPTRDHPSKTDPSWYLTMIQTYKISGETYANDWKQEIATQRQLRGLPLKPAP